MHCRKIAEQIMEIFQAFTFYLFFNTLKFRQNLREIICRNKTIQQFKGTVDVILIDWHVPFTTIALSGITEIYL